MKKLILSLGIHFILICVTCLTLIPMCWLVAATFKHPDYVFSYTFFGPVYSEPKAEDVFIYEFWEEFDSKYTEDNAPEAFTSALTSALETAAETRPEAGLAEAILSENPTLFNKEFPEGYSSDKLAKEISVYLPPHSTEALAYYLEIAFENSINHRTPDSLPPFEAITFEINFSNRFWETFIANGGKDTPEKAFTVALETSCRHLYKELTETILSENPTLFNKQFPDSYNREATNLLASSIDPYIAGEFTDTFTNHLHEGYLESYDPMYIGLPLEQPRAWFPALSWANFNNLFTSIPFGRYVINSFFISCATVLIQLFFSSLAGFALAKYDFRGKKLIMVVMLLTMMIPGQVMLAPLYELIYKMGLVDSYFGLIVPGAVNVFGIFLFRQSMMHIPTDLLEAGRVDGCSELRIYWNIVLPVSRPMIGAFTLISFMGAWNNYLWPQIILHTQARFTLPIGLSQMVSAYEGNYGALMAGTFMSVLPVIVLFFMLQKEFISGLTAGAVKA